MAAVFSDPCWDKYREEIKMADDVKQMLQEAAREIEDHDMHCIQKVFAFFSQDFY